MLYVCKDFAKDYNILFNASRGQLMHLGKDNLNCENLLCMSNGSSIEFVEQCVHLSTKNYSDISKKNIDSTANDLYKRTINLMADFSYAQSSTLSVLYISYCINVYGHSYGVLITINLLNVFTLLGEKQLEEFGGWIKEPTMC